MAYSNIDKPSSYFNTKLYTGNSNATQTISGVGFQPDFTWIKCRSDVEFHHLADAVRGANKFLHSNNTNAERTGSYDGGSNTLAFTSDGFSLTNPTATDDELNFGSRTYASWNWKANGTGVSNTAGSISSTVSANTTSGFSIVAWTPTTTSTPQTIGHGLGVAPSMMIVRNREYAGNWRVYHKSLGATKAVNLNNTDSAITDNGFWENTTPTSTVFTTGNGYGYTTGGSTDDYIAYCFAEVKGYSKFGSYTGNGNADGTFVYTGFTPAFILWKASSDAGYYWQIMDNKRNTTNVAGKNLFPNLSDAEYDYTNAIDFLSNGFKFRTGSGGINTSNVTYIYACFAQNPFVSSKGIVANAR
jgi:hypothetical protein